jgi:C-terminal processing protease CtpA/Prc
MIHIVKKLQLPLISIVLIGLAIFSSCKKDDNAAPELTQKINEFVKVSMEEVYLWENYLPNIDIKYEFDSKAYFDKLLYEEDKWSFITDDIEALEASFAGVETTYGYSLAFGRFSNSGNLFALIEYIYPNSPAELAGLRRGDIIVLVNGTDITEANYTTLFNAASITITKGILNDGAVSQGSSLSMNAEILSLDPVLITKIIETNGRKIGYLFYAQYISNFNASLDNALSYFKDQSITDLVLDLRYNPGGYISAAQYLCSSIAPLSVVTNKEIIVTLQWNDYYQNYWESNQVYSQVRANFDPTVAVNLNLPKVYILTGSGTASASELTITGLDPYMDVVLIGDVTYGKYTGSITIKPEDIFSNPSDYTDFTNWGIQPIVLRYANANGITDFKDGFTPNFDVYDDLWAGIPLGDETEPLLAKAIEQITGITKISSLKKQNVPLYENFARGFSRFDANKQQLIIDNFVYSKDLK